jgi:hypothetical protein
MSLRSMATHPTVMQTLTVAGVVTSGAIALGRDVAEDEVIGSDLRTAPDLKYILSSILSFGDSPRGSTGIVSALPGVGWHWGNLCFA